MYTRIVVVLISLLLALAFVGCASSPSLGYKLAVIDGIASPTRTQVKPYDTELETLAARYHCDQQRIADLAVKCQQLLKADGRTEQSLNLLRAADVADPTGLLKPEEVFAALASTPKP